MSYYMEKYRICNIRLYKINVASESDVGLIIVSTANGHTGQWFQLTRYTGRGGERDSRAGLSKQFEDDIVRFFFLGPQMSQFVNQFFNYIASNFCFKDFVMVPPACPALVFHIDIRRFDQDHAQVDITRFTSTVLSFLRTRAKNAVSNLVPIAPPVTEILDCYQSQDLCCLCESGYPKEDEIVHRTRCNHIFHGTCISRYLLRTPRCPVCSAHLPPIDIRTLLFS